MTQSSKPFTPYWEQPGYEEQTEAWREQQQGSLVDKIGSDDPIGNLMGEGNSFRLAVRDALRNRRPQFRTGIPGEDNQSPGMIGGSLPPAGDDPYSSDGPLDGEPGTGFIGARDPNNPNPPGPGDPGWGAGYNPVIGAPGSPSWGVDFGVVGGGPQNLGQGGFRVGGVTRFFRELVTDVDRWFDNNDWAAKTLTVVGMLTGIPGLGFIDNLAEWASGKLSQGSTPAEIFVDTSVPMTGRQLAAMITADAYLRTYQAQNPQFDISDPMQIAEFGQWLMERTEQIQAMQEATEGELEAYFEEYFASLEAPSTGDGGGPYEIGGGVGDGFGFRGMISGDRRSGAGSGWRTIYQRRDDPPPPPGDG